MKKNSRIRDTKKAEKYLSSKPSLSIELLEKYYQIPIIDEIDIKQLSLLSRAYENSNQMVEATKYKNLFYLFSKEDNEASENLKECLSIYTKYSAEFLSGCNNEQQLLEKMILCCVELSKKIEGALLYYFYEKRYGARQDLQSLLSKKDIDLLPYIDYILKKECVFVLIQSDSEIGCFNAGVFELIASSFGHQVIVISNKKTNHNGKHLFVNSLDTTNIRRVLLELEKDNTSVEPFVVLADSHLLKEIVRFKKMYKHFEMYYRQSLEIPLPYLDCLLLGDFYKTSSFLYGFDTKRALRNEPKYDYSIVIPARNSSECLEYALMNCASIDYQDSKYEILVSDNSDCGNNAIETMVKNMQVIYKNIRYVRPPIVLSLCKSFEFAYLNACGRRIISIGSDDGIMIGALKDLDNIFEKYDSLVVHFQSVNYMWPDNSGFASLVYREVFFPNNKEDMLFKTKELANCFLTGKYPFQFLPILYMNTCVDRQLIDIIIENTGKLEFGYSQDVYTGLIVLMLLDSIVYTRKPLIIGGSSSIGIGKLVKDSERNPKIYKYKMLNNDLCHFNYFSKNAEDCYKVLLYTENERWFIFTEFVKIIELEISHKYRHYSYPEDEILGSLKSMYMEYDLLSNDISFIQNRIDSIKVFLGETLFQKYLRFERNWIKNRKKKAKRERAIHFLKKIHFYAFVRHFFSMFSKSSNKQLNDTALPICQSSHYSINILNKKKELSNIYEASKYINVFFERGIN